MSDCVYVLPRRSHFRVSKTLEGPGYHAIPTMSVCLSIGDLSYPSRGLTKILLLPWVSREWFVGTKMV